MKPLIASLAILCLAASALANDKTELDGRMRKLTFKFEAMQRKPDKCIPAETLRKAQGIILLDRTKAGLIFGFQGGSGVALVKDPKTEQWSPAAFLKATEASLGAQVGIQQSFIVILFMTTNATHALTEPNFEFGGEARGTAGDATGGVEGAISSHEQAMLVYADRKGLYGGAVIKGEALSPDPNANLIYYEKAVTTHDILFDQQVKPTKAAVELAKKITEAAAAVVSAPPAPAPTARKMKSAEPPPKEHQRIMAARPARPSANTQASTASADGGMGQLLLLIADFEANQQTNALKLLNNYLTTMTTTMQAADAATTVTILEQLRTGHRAEAI